MNWNELPIEVIAGLYVAAFAGLIIAAWIVGDYEPKDNN